MGKLVVRSGIDWQQWAWPVTVWRPHVHTQKIGEVEKVNLYRVREREIGVLPKWAVVPEIQVRQGGEGTRSGIAI